MKYPDDFRDWSSGVEIPNSIIQKWVDEIIEEELDYIASGNTIAIKIEDEIIVAKDYERVRLND